MDALGMSSGRMWKLWFVALTVLCSVSTAGAEAVPPLIGSAGATLEDIAGTSTLVTVVLKDSGAQDKNLRILEVEDVYLAVLSEDGERSAYLFSSIEEIHVQGGKVDRKKFQVDVSRTFRVAEMAVIERAFARAREIFAVASDDQSTKMRAAALVALDTAGDETAAAEARAYLEGLAESNDLATSLQAMLHLYLVGQTTPIPKTLHMGLESGNRKARIAAAALAGLTQDQSSEEYLVRMLQDRAEDLAAPAARAIARLKYLEAVPTLLGMISELSSEKGDAAVFALSELGGADIAEQMKLEYESVTGEIQFRVAKVLYNIGDPRGRELIQDEFMAVPTLAEQAALILAKEGDTRAMQFLQSKLDGRFDNIEERLIIRADTATALVEGGDPGAISVLQELMRSDYDNVVIHVCDLIGELGKRKLLALTQPPIESVNTDVALAAATAAISIYDPDGFRNRLLAMRQ